MMRAIAGGHLRGVFCMVLAVAAFSLMDASMKILAPCYPSMQVAALRGVTSLPLVIVSVLLDGGSDPRTLNAMRALRV